MLKILILAIIILFLIERIRLTFFGYKEPKGGKIMVKWITYYLLGMYSLITLMAIIECFVKKTKINIVISITGLLLLLIGRLLRNSSMRLLKNYNSWSLHTKIFENQKLIKKGPYAYVSNPYYFGTLLELLGIIFLLNSYISFFSMLLLFIPILIVRILIEERALAKVS